MRRLLPVLMLACAPLNLATLSEPCRYVYKACLDRCPSSAPPLGGGSLPAIKPDYDQVGVAACTQQCNDQARSCR